MHALVTNIKGLKISKVKIVKQFVREFFYILLIKIHISDIDDAIKSRRRLNLRER